MNINHLTIYTDSHFVIQTATHWLMNWCNNGWKTSSGKDVKNKQDLVELDGAIKGLKKVIWKHVPAHSGSKGNEEADRLANLAIANLLGTKIQKFQKDDFEIEDLEEEPYQF